MTAESEFAANDNPAAEQPGDAALPVLRSRRSGSETRVRGKLIGYRASDAEYAEAHEKASRAGLTVASYARAMMHSKEPVRAVPLPVIDRKLLRELLGELGKIGSNVNQLARASNARHAIKPEEVSAFFEAFIELREAVLVALSREPK